MTVSVYARALARGPLDPECWLPASTGPYPVPPTGRRPAITGPVLEDLRGRYRALVDAYGDAGIHTIHKAVCRQMRDDFFGAWRTLFDLDPSVRLEVITPAGARRAGGLVSEGRPEKLLAVLTGALVTALGQNRGNVPAGAAFARRPEYGGPASEVAHRPGPTGVPVHEYSATSSHRQRNRPEPLPIGLLAVAPNERRQAQMRDGVRSFVADAYLDGAAGLPSAFFAGRPGFPSRPATCQDLLLRVDRGYASGTERAAYVVGHVATIDDLARVVVAHFDAVGARIEWGVADHAADHAGLVSRDAQVPRALLRLALGASPQAGDDLAGALDPALGPLLRQTGPTPVWSMLGVGWAAWIRVLVDGGDDEWFSVRALAGGPSGRCCPAGVTLVTSTLLASASA